jgi:hypothetical protein
MRDSEIFQMIMYPAAIFGLLYVVYAIAKAAP